MSLDANGLLEALGATPVSGQPKCYDLTLDALGLISVFGGGLSGTARAEVLSTHAFCFQSPPELSVLGPLWVENLERQREVISTVSDALVRLKRKLAEDARTLVGLGFEAPCLLPPVPQACAVWPHGERKLLCCLHGDDRIRLAWVDDKSLEPDGFVVQIPKREGTISLQEQLEELLQQLDASAPGDDSSLALSERVTRLEANLGALLARAEEVRAELQAIQEVLRGEAGSRQPDALPRETEQKPPEVVPLAPATSRAPERKTTKSSLSDDEVALPVVISTSELIPVASEARGGPSEDENEEPSFLDSMTGESTDQNAASLLKAVPDSAFEGPATVAMDLAPHSGSADALATLAAESTDQSVSQKAISVSDSAFEGPATVAMDLASPNAAADFVAEQEREKSSERSQDIAPPDESQTSSKPERSEDVGDNEDFELAAFFEGTGDSEAGIFGASDDGEPIQDRERVHAIQLPPEEDSDFGGLDEDFLEEKTEAYILGSADSAVLQSEPDFDSEIESLEDSDTDSLRPEVFPAESLTPFALDEEPPLETSAPTAISAQRKPEPTADESPEVFDDDEGGPGVALVLPHEKARRKLSQKLSHSVSSLVAVAHAADALTSIDENKIQTLVFVRPKVDVLDEIARLKSKYPHLQIFAVTNDYAFGESEDVALVLPLVNQVSRVAQSIIEALDLV